MGKPAARVGDMHMCPMATPGTPPIPHVGGPITGPGVPTVMIGGVPAAVMGDMCTCVGPPDTIVLGSTGVFIGGKPAARMGDQCAHGGAITVGCPTVLIGEMSGGAGGAGAGGLASLPVAMLQNVMENMPPKQKAQVAQIVVLKNAAASGKPFCEKCAAAAMEAKGKALGQLFEIKQVMVITNRQMLQLVENKNELFIREILTALKKSRPEWVSGKTEVELREIVSNANNIAIKCNINKEENRNKFIVFVVDSNFRIENEKKMESVLRDPNQDEDIRIENFFLQLNSGLYKLIPITLNTPPELQ